MKFRRNKSAPQEVMPQEAPPVEVSAAPQTAHDILSPYRRPAKLSSGLGAVGMHQAQTETPSVPGEFSIDMQMVQAAMTLRMMESLERIAGSGPNQQSGRIDHSTNPYSSDWQPVARVPNNQVPSVVAGVRGGELTVAGPSYKGLRVLDSKPAHQRRERVLSKLGETIKQHKGISLVLAGIAVAGVINKGPELKERYIRESASVAEAGVLGGAEGGEIISTPESLQTLPIGILDMEVAGNVTIPFPSATQPDRVIEGKNNPEFTSKLDMQLHLLTEAPYLVNPDGTPSPESAITVSKDPESGKQTVTVHMDKIQVYARVDENNPDGAYTFTPPAIFDEESAGIEEIKESLMKSMEDQSAEAFGPLEYVALKAKFDESKLSILNYLTLLGIRSIEASNTNELRALVTEVIEADFRKQLEDEGADMGSVEFVFTEAQMKSFSESYKTANTITENEAPIKIDPTTVQPLATLKVKAKA